MKNPVVVDFTEIIEGVKEHFERSKACWQALEPKGTNKTPAKSPHFKKPRKTKRK